MVSAHDARAARGNSAQSQLACSLLPPPAPPPPPPPRPGQPSAPRPGQPSASGGASPPSPRLAVAFACVFFLFNCPGTWPFFYQAGVAPRRLSGTFLFFSLFLSSLFPPWDLALFLPGRHYAAQAFGRFSSLVFKFFVSALGPGPFSTRPALRRAGFRAFFRFKFCF